MVTWAINRSRNISLGATRSGRAVFKLTRVCAFIVLALLCGVGIVYAPMPVFVAVAAILILGLSSLAWGNSPSSIKLPTFRERGHKLRSSMITKLVSGYLLIWWLALVAPILAFSPRGATSEVTAQAAASGSLLNQLLFGSFGLVGAAFLPSAIRRFDPAFRWVATLWGLYLCWGFVSLIWSVYPPLTVRNVIAFVLVSVGSFGLGAGFYGSLPNGRDLFLRHVFAAGVISALAMLGPLPIHWSTYAYAFLDPTFELEIGGDFPTYVARPAMCALLVLVATAILRVRGWLKRDWLWVAVLVLPLLILKTRGPLLFALLALGIFYLSYRTRLHDRILQGALLLVIGLGTYTAYSQGLLATIILYLTRGNLEGAATLTGRIPLWNAVLPEIVERPWLGAGFAAFWNPDTYFRMEQIVGFPAKSAHNGFLEELLNTGVVGLVLLLAFFLYTMAMVRAQARRGDDLGWLVFLLMTFYLLLNVTTSLVQDFLQLLMIVILGSLGIMASRPLTNNPPSRKASIEAGTRADSARYQNTHPTEIRRSRRKA